MDTIFMNSEKFKTFDPHRLILDLSDKVNLHRSDKYIELSNLSAHSTSKCIKKSYKEKFKTSAPALNQKT